MRFYNEIKTQLINNEITKRVKDYSKNKSDLTTYYNVGKLLSEAGKHYGEGIIKEYSIRLANDLGKKYNVSTLKRMRQFYQIVEKGAPLVHQLTWSHYIELIPLKNINKINYYIKLCITQHLSKRELRNRIKNNEYERLDDNTKIKLIDSKETDITDFVKDPIVIKNNNYEIITEKILQKLILEDIPSFLKELGNGYTFVDNEYKIKIGDRYNYIDLLLFNYIYNCFIVIELKVTELRKEHIGQIHTYMNYIDKNIKSINHNNTIGIIIVKKNNKYILEYCSDDRIITREFILI